MISKNTSNELEPTPKYNAPATTRQGVVNWKSAWFAASGIWKGHAIVENDIQQIREGWHNRIE